VPLGDGVDFSNREVASANDVESRTAINNPGTHRRVRAGPLGALGTSPRGGDNALERNVGVGAHLQSEVSGLPSGPFTIDDPNLKGPIAPFIIDSSHVLARRTAMTIGRALELGRPTRPRSRNRPRDLILDDLFWLFLD
jgi:hypothetical protein